MVKQDFESADFYRAEDEYSGVLAAFESDELWEAVAETFRQIDDGRDCCDKVEVTGYVRKPTFDSSRCGHIGAWAAILAIKQEISRHYGEEVPIDSISPYIRDFSIAMSSAASKLASALDSAVDKEIAVGSKTFDRVAAAELIREHDAELADSILAKATG